MDRNNTGDLLHMSPGAQAALIFDLEFQRQRAEKWVAVVERRDAEIESFKEALAARDAELRDLHAALDGRDEDIEAFSAERVELRGRLETARTELVARDAERVQLLTVMRDVADAVKRGPDLTLWFDALAALLAEVDKAALQPAPTGGE